MSQEICFCLDCRTTLHTDDVCDQADDHRVVSLAKSGAHEELVAVAWGSAPAREQEDREALRLERAVTLLSMGVLGAGLLAALVLFSPITLPHIVGVMIAALVVLIGGIHVVTRRERQFPIGAAHLLTDTRLNGCGQVSGESQLCSPATATLCLAYAVELHLEGKGRDRVMYRDAVTCGFEIDLDDGSRARVPKGRIRILGDMRQTIDTDNRELESYLEEVDGRRSEDNAYDPFRYNVVYETVLLSGDRVELLSPFEPQLNSKAPLTLYRKSMPSVLVPHGVPCIRQLTSTI